MTGHTKWEDVRDAKFGAPLTDAELTELDELHHRTAELALESIQRWADRTDLSVERRLAAIRTVCAVALVQ